MKFAKFLILASILVSPLAQAEVWKATAQWDNTYEQAFSKFIAELPLDYFVKEDHPWGRISTDCADAAYALRIIFAYNHSLPVSFSTWQGPKTNEMMDFDSVSDPIQRVRKFIHHVNAFTNTSTLAKDTYPLAIVRGQIHPGHIFLHKEGDKDTPVTYRPGHAYYLQKVAENGLITYISSTVPAEIRKLNPRIGINFAPMDTDSGYRAWKWPDHETQASESQDQFGMAGWYPKSYRDTKMWMRWQLAIRQKLAYREATADELLLAQMENLKVQVVDRIFNVLKAYEFYQNTYAGQGCLSEKDYKNYSTPTRDQKIQVELQHFGLAAKNYVRAYGSDPNDPNTMHAFYEQFGFTVIKGTRISVNQLRSAFLTKTALQISEPEHTPAQRWGLVHMERSDWTCPERAKNYVGGQ